MFRTVDTPSKGVGWGVYPPYTAYICNIYGGYTTGVACPAHSLTPAYPYPYA